MSANSVSNSSQREDVLATGNSDAVKPVSNSSPREDVLATGGSDTRERKHKSTKSSLIGKLLTNWFRIFFKKVIMQLEDQIPVSDTDEPVSHSSLEGDHATGGSDTCERH